MKLTVGDIRFSESGYASATVEVGTGTFPFLLFTLCKMDVSVPLVEGKALEQYKDELLAKARERIDEIYKEIVSKHCSEHSIARGNQQYGSFQDAVDAGESKAFKVEHGKITINTSQVESISPSSKDNLEERITALEKRLSGKKTVHASEKVVEFYNHDGTLAVRMGDLNQAEKRLTEEARDDNEFRRIYDIAKIAAKDIISPAKSDFQ